MNLLIAGGLFFLMSALCMWVTIKAIREGIASTRFIDCYRKEDPIAFWLLVTFYGTGALVFLFRAASTVGDLTQSGF